MCPVDVLGGDNVVVTGVENGPTVLLAHGFGCDQNPWLLVVPAPAERFRVVLVDPDPRPHRTGRDLRRPRHGRARRRGLGRPVLSTGRPRAPR
ncbi:alpha/beta fold hydrolase [Umezawaea tangerina]|uniref:alpha/beta fold hydrolase n=1 Tax=Umezawaea tangerina TaxID=84725 RepID=UPI001FE48BF0|nr:hypothetical protein [Umezawaea tangerina]